MRFKPSQTLPPNQAELQLDDSSRKIKKSPRCSLEAANSGQMRTAVLRFFSRCRQTPPKPDSSITLRLNRPAAAWRWERGKGQRSTARKSAQMYTNRLAKEFRALSNMASIAENC